MEFGENLVKTIRFRQEGKDVLSWIENFGLHLFDENCKLNVPFNNGEKNEVLVLRIDRKTNTINAYYCFFQTDNRGFTRFCVNKYTEDNDAYGLKELMDNANWANDSTKNYWKEVFCDGKVYKVDETVLKGPETKTSSSEEMNMMEYIERIQEEIQNVIIKLCIPANGNISKVLIVGQYAAALPLKYALGRIFPNAKKMVFHYIWKEEKKTWQQNCTHFHIPGKLLHSGFNTTPQMTIGDVLSLREKGVTFTLPLSKNQNGKYCLPATPIIDNSELKWNELIKEDIEPDYIVGNLSFKRVDLSVFADGFQNVFMNSGESLISISCNNNGIIIKNKSISTDAPKVATTYGAKSTKQIKKTEDPQTTTSPYDTDEDIEKKMRTIKHIIDDALEDTTIFLETVAKLFFKEKYPIESWEEKYGEAIPASKKYSEMRKNWNDSHQVEFSNFAFFLSHFRSEILGSKDNPGVKWWKQYNHVVCAVDQLKPIRNTKQHGYSKVVGIGLRNLSNCLNAMENLATVLDNLSLKNKIVDYYNELQSNFDNSVKEQWNNSEKLQEIYRQFEEKKVLNK